MGVGWGSSGDCRCSATTHPPPRLGQTGARGKWWWCPLSKGNPIGPASGGGPIHREVSDHAQMAAHNCVESRRILVKRPTTTTTKKSHKTRSNFRSFNETATQSYAERFVCVCVFFRVFGLLSACANHCIFEIIKFGDGCALGFVCKSLRLGDGNDRNNLAQFVNGNDWRAWPVLAFLGADAAGAVNKRKCSSSRWLFGEGAFKN